MDAPVEGELQGPPVEASATRSVSARLSGGAGGPGRTGRVFWCSWRRWPSQWCVCGGGGGRGSWPQWLAVGAVVVVMRAACGRGLGSRACDGGWLPVGWTSELEPWSRRCPVPASEPYNSLKPQGLLIDKLRLHHVVHLCSTLSFLFGPRLVAHHVRPTVSPPPTSCHALCASFAREPTSHSCCALLLGPLQGELLRSSHPRLKVLPTPPATPACL